MPTQKLHSTDFQQALRRQELMDRMMQNSGVTMLSAISVTGEALLGARPNCRFCKNESSCREWLDCGDSPPCVFRWLH
jgi:hypothetical protein